MHINISFSQCKAYKATSVLSILVSSSSLCWGLGHLFSRVLTSGMCVCARQVVLIVWFLLGCEELHNQFMSKFN